MTSSTIDRVTGLTGNVAWKPPCVAATTANITLAGLQTIDGIVLAEYDRVLVMNQTDNTTNGIYIASSSTWQRAADFDDNRDAVNGTRVAVTGGSTLIGAYQLYTTDDTVVFGTTSIVFVSAGVNANDFASNAEMIAGLLTSKAGAPASVKVAAEYANFTPTGTGSVARSIRAKLRDMISVKDFGAVGDNVTNDTAAIQAAIDAQVGPLYFPPGTYLCTAALKVYNETALYGFGGTPGTTVAGMSRLRFTGTGTACITQNNLAASVQHGCIRDLAVLADTGSTYSWVFDFEDLLGWTFSGIGAVNQNSAGGVFRSRRIVAGDANWVNRLYDCEFVAPFAGSAFVVDVTWTDAQIWGCNFDGGKGVITRGDGNVAFIGCQFNRAASGAAGATASKETASVTSIMFLGCAFDANVTTGLTLDATSSPSAAIMAVTVTGCNFRNPSGTQDILCVDGPLALSGIGISNCKFTDATVATGVTFNAAKWTIDFANNYYASGWKEPSQTFTPSISFGGAAVGVTYTTQTGWYRKDGNRITFLLVITLSSKGSSVGAVTLSGLPVAAAQQTPVVVGTNSNFTGLTGALNAQISGGGIILNQQGAAGTASVTDTSCTNTTSFRISGSYLIA